VDFSVTNLPMDAGQVEFSVTYLPKEAGQEDSAEVERSIRNFKLYSIYCTKNMLLYTF
jgi:hypothetical protein